MWEKTCLYCQSPMKIESSSRGITTYGCSRGITTYGCSRGITTYGCSRGCSDYQYEEKTAQAAAPVILNGTLPVGLQGSGARALTAAMT